MKCIYTVLSVAVCSAALASEVTWTGAVNMTWDTSTANWQDADGVACCFTSGDDVVFGPSSSDRTVNVPYGSKWTVGTMVVDSDALVKVSGHIVGMDRVVKRGMGRLTFQGDQSTWEGDIDIEEGEFHISGLGGYGQSRGEYVNPVKGHLGNGQAERTITIGPNGRFYNEDPWPFGGPLSTPNVRMVVDGAISNIWVLSGYGNAGIAFSDLVLNSSDFGMGWEDRSPAVSGLEARVWPSFAWNGDVWFNMPEVFTLEKRGGINIGTGSRMPTLYVPDISGDDLSDVIIKKAIVDSVPIQPVQEGGVYTHFAYPSAPSRFVKDGAGTLELYNDVNELTGDIVVKGGTLRVVRGPGGTLWRFGALGNPHVARSIVIQDGAVLEVKGRDVMGTVRSSLLTTYAVTNATVRLGSDGMVYSLNFGNIDFFNGRIEYTGNGHNVGGYFNLGAKARIDGTEPCVFRSTGGYNNIQLGYATDKVEEIVDPAGTGDYTQMEATYTGCTEFDIRDITGDGAADLIVEAVLRDIPSASNYNNDRRELNRMGGEDIPKTRTFHCGLKKVGPGSMLLKNNSNPYTGVTVVEEGALLVDGTINNSPVTVKAGGLVGGRGTVPSLEVQEGGGFVVNCTNGMAQVSVTGAYTLPEAGVLWLTGYEGAVESVRGVRVFSLVDADNAEAVNASAWTVRMDGFSAKDTRDVEVERDGDMLVVTYRQKGTTILVR